MIKLNMGCGLDYKEGDNWINVDFNTAVIIFNIYLIFSIYLFYQICFNRREAVK